MGCVSFVLREKHRLTVFENRVLRRIFGPKREEVRGGRTNIMKSSLICTLQQIKVKK
jgi:hypothetical protein